MFRLVLFVTLVLETLGLNHAWGAAGNGPIDLSVGIATPSNNGSILENPSGLAGYSSKIFDLGVYINSITSPDFAGSFSSGNSGFGYGLEVQRAANNFQASGAFAAGLGKFSLGVNATTYFSPFSVQVGAGVRNEFKNFILALYFPNLMNLLQVWTVGFGVAVGTGFRFGTDLGFSNNSPGFGVSGATITAIAEAYASSKYSIRLSYGIGVIPSFANSLGIGAGFSYWFSKKVAFYGIYNSPTYLYTLGLKFAL